MAETSKNSDSENKRNIDIRPSEIDRLKNSLSKNDNYSKPLDNQIDYLLNKFQEQPIIVTRLDYYGNAIPLGAFCYAVSFILYGFYETKIFKEIDRLIYLVMLFFGGLGQITSGMFEYIKSRTFPTILYLLYGIYFISFFFFKYKYSEESDDKKRDYLKYFFGTWAGLSFPIFIGSIRTNLIYLIQNVSVCGFFVVKCIAECHDIPVLREKVAGILELVTGFFSIYLCFSQIINEHFKRSILPTIKLKLQNEIDLYLEK